MVWGFDTYWIWIPDGTRPGEIEKGDMVRLPGGERVVVVATSTLMLMVRPLRLWERLWVRLVSSKSDG